MTTNNHEVIFAIVNAGYAEEAMDVAREQGVRGGTILNARGVAKPNEAAFFGITIHHEKEILMMVVERTSGTRCSMPSTRRWAWRKRPRASSSPFLFLTWPVWCRWNRRRKQSRNN